MAPSTAEAVSLPFEEAIAFFRQKTRLPAEDWTSVWRDAHARAFSVAGATSDALTADFQKAIQKALSEGTTLAEFRRDFDAIVKRHGWEHTGTPGWRASIIYETNLATAYSAGRYAQQTDPAVLAAFPYWVYRHSGAAHPRLMHLAWDGLTLRADDPFWEAHYPPNGWRCGCRVSVTSEDGLRRMGKTEPDAAPPTVTEPWVNPRTGETHQVPVGVDPGFDYNPGAAWKKAPLRAEPLRPLRPEAAPGPIVPHEFGSVADADATLTREYAAWANGLSKDEADALETYKGPLGRRMNTALRTDTASALLGDEISLLGAALGRARAPYALRLFRGASAEEAALYRKRGVGRKVAVASFISTSIDAEVAGTLGGAGAVVEILVPDGMAGVAYVHPTPRYRFRQYEMLLNRGTTLRVVSIEGERIVLEVARGDE